MENPLLKGLNGFTFYTFDPIQKPRAAISNYLFTHPNHFYLQKKRGWKSLGLKVNGKAISQITFYISLNTALSPLKAPFGSMQSNRHLTSEEMTFFIHHCLMFLKDQGVKNIEIRNFPEAYEPIVTKLLYNGLLSHGFTARQHISSIIIVDEKDFESKINTSEKQKLRKCRSTLQFHKAQADQLPRIYRFIETCRLEKKQNLSMSLTELKKTINLFPKNFFLFEIVNTTGTAAAGVVIKVNREILYTFYYAHSKEFDKISPVVFLLSGIYQFAQRANYKLIDLGTSMTGDEINKPLLHFKKSIGGKPSPKFIFEKNLR